VENNGKVRLPDKLIAIVCQIRDSKVAHVLEDGAASEAFPVTNGVKQECVPAPLLFNTMFTAMLTDAFRNHNDEQMATSSIFDVSKLLLK